MPRPVVVLPCGSRSMRRVGCPSTAIAAPRLMAVVVSPPPPILWATATVPPSLSATPPGGERVSPRHESRLPHQQGLGNRTARRKEEQGPAHAVRKAIVPSSAWHEGWQSDNPPGAGGLHGHDGSVRCNEWSGQREEP